ncbi:ABC transporter ATP-binding protein [Candidatus Bathyarchaeota archaeon]|nr:MAG: ABC transporter ATP-binding protein [Candidatus Bathyarchaeota archaeon]
MPSIKLVNVTKRFNGITAIDRLSLEIEDQEYVCVLGPTGSGKTTLLRLIAGVIKPDSGEIYIDGELVNDVPPQERNVAYVPQRYALFTHLKVIENVAFGPVSRGVRRTEALKLSMKFLEMMRLAWRADSYPDELSGGMQQRLALARGLASGAKILLLDEPLGALDARLRVELRYKLRELVKSQGLTAIHVTHDQEEALVVADKIVVLRHGRVQQVGDPFSVYNEPRNIFVANFVGGANFLEGFVANTAGGKSKIQLRGNLSLEVEGEYPVGERVVVAVREEATGITGETELVRTEETNLIPGIVDSVSFLGSFVLYEVTLLNGDKVSSKVPVQADHRKFMRGDKVLIQIDPRQTRVYKYPPAGLYKELEAI